MTTTHTPGPWIAKPLTYNWSIESEQGHPVARIPLNDVTYHDLRLMNAAPDLLKALRLLVIACTEDVAPDGYTTLGAPDRASMRDAIAAIAKAGGAA